jgi:hypothetical protein
MAVFGLLVKSNPSDFLVYVRFGWNDWLVVWIS